MSHLHCEGCTVQEGNPRVTNTLRTRTANFKFTVVVVVAVVVVVVVVVKMLSGTLTYTASNVTMISE